MTKHVVFIVENQAAPHDVRVWTEALTIKKMGYNVSIISRQNEKVKEKFECVAGIDIYRHPLPIDKNSILGYSLEYLSAFIWETILCLRLFLKKRFQFIHSANPPDHIFLIALFFKIFGVKYIFDHHDLTPELFLTKSSKKNKIIYRILIGMEKLSCKVADAVISSNNSYKQLVVRRHKISPKKVFVVRNDPVLSDYESSEDGVEKDKNGFKVLLYIGSINHQDGVDILIQAIRHLINEFNEERFICYIVGDGESLKSLKELAANLGLNKHINFTGFIYDKKVILGYLKLADICLESAPYNELNRHSTFIKIMQYMAVGKPIVAFRLTETVNSAKGAAIFIDPGDVIGFSKAIKTLMDDEELRVRLGKAGITRVRQELNWEKASHMLRDAYEYLESDEDDKQGKEGNERFSRI